MIATPEHDKLKLVQPFSQKIHEFVLWLANEKFVHLAQYGNIEDGMGDELFLTPVSTTKFVAEFLDIDLKKLEDEKLAMIDEIRKSNEQAKTDRT